MRRDRKFFQAVVENSLISLKYALVVVVAALAVAIIVDYSGIKKPIEPDDQDVLQNFLGWFAGIYTLALGTIVGYAWNKLNSINLEIDREADALALLSRTAKMCMASQWVESLSLAIRVYVSELRIAGVEDKQFDLKSQQSSATYLAMKDIQLYVYKVITDTGSSECLKAELLRHYFDACDARTDRFDIAAQRIPGHIWMILAGSSVAWLWGFFWLKTIVSSLSIYMLICALFFLTYSFGLARDLDNAVTGFWRMKFTPFKVNEF